MQVLSRRSLLKIASIAIPCEALLSRVEALNSPTERLPVNDSSPAHPPELVREMSIVAPVEREPVRELEHARRAMARPARELEFGDGGEALGAAWHMRNRAIALWWVEQG